MRRTLPIILCSLLLASGCDLPGTSGVIDTRVPPVIIEASVTPNAIDMGKISTPGANADVTVRGYVNTSDDNGASDIAAVHFTIIDPDGVIIKSGLLTDNGTAPDFTAGDGKYATDIPLSLPKAVIGTYIMQYTTEDKEGYLSNTFSLPLKVTYSLNHAPTVSNFIAPDTIFVPASSTNLIKTIVKASDAEGLGDLSKVALSIVRVEDSTVVAVYSLYDDGGKVAVPPFSISSGDSIAGDGNYTLAIPVPNNTLKNIQRYFNVFAVDQSDAVSNIITKKVLFK